MHCLLKKEFNIIKIRGNKNLTIWKRWETK
jgi:hypothetical protein